MSLRSCTRSRGTANNPCATTLRRTASAKRIVCLVPAVLLSLFMSLACLGLAGASRVTVRGGRNEHSSSSSRHPSKHGSHSAKSCLHHTGRSLKQIPYEPYGNGHYDPYVGGVTPGLVNVDVNRETGLHVGVGDVTVDVSADKNYYGLGIGNVVGVGAARDRGWNLQVGGGNVLDLSVTRDAGLGLWVLDGLVNVNIGPDGSQFEAGRIAAQGGAVAPATTTEQPAIASVVLNGPPAPATPAKPAAAPAVDPAAAFAAANAAPITAPVNSSAVNTGDAVITEDVDYSQTDGKITGPSGMDLLRNSDVFSTQSAMRVAAPGIAAAQALSTATTQASTTATTQTKATATPAGAAAVQLEAPGAVSPQDYVVARPVTTASGSDVEWSGKDAYSDTPQVPAQLPPLPQLQQQQQQEQGPVVAEVAATSSTTTLAANTSVTTQTSIQLAQQQQHQPEQIGAVAGVAVTPPYTPPAATNSNSAQLPAQPAQQQQPLQEHQEDVTAAATPAQQQQEQGQDIPTAVAPPTQQQQQQQQGQSLTAAAAAAAAPSINRLVRPAMPSYVVSRPVVLTADDAEWSAADAYSNIASMRAQLAQQQQSLQKQPQQ